METLLAVLVLLVLLAIAVWGLMVSSRDAGRNDAVRRARRTVQTGPAARQQTQDEADMSSPTYRPDRTP